MVVLAAAALACLTACNLGTGIFPDKLMTYEGFADLSGYIERDRAWSYDFRIISAGPDGPEYLVLASDDDSIQADNVVVLDSNVKVLGHWSMSELDAMDAAPFQGWGSMVDAAGDIVVGNRRFHLVSRSLRYAGLAPQPIYGTGLVLMESLEKPNFADIFFDTMSSSFFNYTRFTIDWMSPDSFNPVFRGGPEKAFLGGLWLRATDILALVQVEGQPWRVHRLDRVKLADGSLCTPIEAWYPGDDLYQQGSLEGNTLGYTKDGFAAFFRDPIRKYQRFDEFGTLLAESPAVTDENWPYEERHLYGRNANWFVYRMKDLTIERRKWWWLP